MFRIISKALIVRMNKLSRFDIKQITVQSRLVFGEMLYKAEDTRAI